MLGSLDISGGLGTPFATFFCPSARQNQGEVIEQCLVSMGVEMGIIFFEKCRHDIHLTTAFWSTRRWVQQWFCVDSFDVKVQFLWRISQDIFIQSDCETSPFCYPWFPRKYGHVANCSLLRFRCNKHWTYRWYMASKTNHSSIPASAFSWYSSSLYLYLMSRSL